MRQDVERRIAQWVQAKAVQEGVELVIDAQAAVLQVAVVEAQPWIDEALADAEAGGVGGEGAEIVADFSRHVVVKPEVRHVAHRFALDVAQDDRGIEVGGQPQDVVAVAGARHVENVGPGAGAGLQHLRVIAFHRHQQLARLQRFHHRQQAVELLRDVGLPRLRQGRFGTHVDDVRAVLVQLLGAGDGFLSRPADAFAVPRIGGQVDHADQIAVAVEIKRAPANVEGPYRLANGLTMRVQQALQHPMIQQR